MKRVLWVEDDERIRRAAGRLCKASGVWVDFSPWGSDAKLAMAEFREYVAVVADFDLGHGPNGQDVLADAERVGIPIRILCSSGVHGANCPAATVIYDKMGMREMVEDVLAPLFAEEK